MIEISDDAVPLPPKFMSRNHPARLHFPLSRVDYLLSTRSRGTESGPATDTYSLHIRVRAFAVFGDEAVDPCRHNGQRHRAELEHSIVESADVEFRSERLLRSPGE